MMKKQLRRKAGFVMVRNTLAFALGAVLATAPAVGWAGTSAKGDFETPSIFDPPYTVYEDLSKAVEDLNEIALKGWENKDTTSKPNDLNLEIHISTNETVEGDEGTGSAIKLDGTKYDSDGNPEVIKGFHDIDINGHGSILNGNNSGTGTMLYIANASGDITISNLSFLNGDAKEGDLDPSDTTYGAVGLMINPNRADGAITAGFESVTLSNVLIQNNRGTISDGASSAGGGMSIFNYGEVLPGNILSQGGVLTMEGFSLVKNTSEAKGGTLSLGASNAFGGGAGLANLDEINYKVGQVSGNQALSTGGLMAGGGGLHASSDDTYSADFKGVEFSGNTARISSGSGTSANPVQALGGAYLGETSIVQTSVGDVATALFSDYTTDGRTYHTTFTGNKAVASGAYAEALGGAAAFLGGIDTKFEEVNFTNNTADASAGSAAYGGALYTQASASFKNSSFIDNSAAGATAYGGAIFLDASVTTNTAVTELELNMTVEAGRTVLISGNTAGGQASGVYFGNVAADDSQKDGVFNILNDGRMEIRDPMTVALNNGKTFTMSVAGEGSLYLAGKNTISAEGGTEINFSQGATELTKDFSLVVINDPSSNFDLNITQAGADQNTLIFDSRRDSAMIDLTGAGNSKSFLVDAAALKINTTDDRRQLVDYQKTLVIVAGAGAGADYLVDQFNTQEFGDRLQGSKFAAVDGNVTLDLDYISPYTDALKKAGKNTASGASALTAVLQYDEITEEMLDYIHANYNTLTPEYGLVAGTMGLNVNQFVSRMAVRQALRGQHNGSLPTPLSVQPSFGGPHNGARVWGGYAGNFRTVENSSGYYGYDQDTSAALVGLSYDLSPAATVGIYGGYSNNKAKMNNMSSEVESDGTHLGLLARLSPGAAVDPNLAIYLDAGYSRYENDAYRRLGGERITSNFDQTAYTAGIGAEYAVPVSYEVLLTPSLDLRYTKLEQDSYREKGFIAGYLKGYDLNSFTSSLALSASREISIRGGTLTPSARLGWNHEYGDTNVNTTARYLNPGGGLLPTTYKMGTVDQNRDSMDAGVGLRALMNSGSYHQVGLNFSYDVNISKDADTHSVYGGLEYSF